MQLRDALIRQAPSLELQRAAAAEIAHLDGEVARLRTAMTAVVNDWTAQFERHGHLAPAWARAAREALGQISS